MSLYTAAGPIPRHQYAWLEPNAIGDHGWLPVVWFGLAAFPGRTWGCHVLLECGAVYRNVPLHKLAARQDAEATWLPVQAQTWDCYGSQFSTVAYPYLDGLDARVKCAGKEFAGRYLFTAIPIGDAFSAEPGQAKEFYFAALDNGRYTAQPTNHVLIEEKSFTTRIEWPKFLRRQTESWSSE